MALSGLFQVSTDYLLQDGAPSPAGEPARVRAACVLLECGNVLRPALLFVLLLLLWMLGSLLTHQLTRALKSP